MARSQPQITELTAGTHVLPLSFPSLLPDIVLREWTLEGSQSALCPLNKQESHYCGLVVVLEHWETFGSRSCWTESSHHLRWRETGTFFISLPCAKSRFYMMITSPLVGEWNTSKVWSLWPKSPGKYIRKVSATREAPMAALTLFRVTGDACNTRELGCTRN